ncbi:SDR family oxidoreductase [Corynebacterium sp. TAE3-ERU12]|uniref:SDR family oxidoreductase n=1 Tax=Corynebacterium sp. TAE3-ERU12 TaxID=2849491 RepID=UPI001C45DFF5|nr:SDR family oxidoreductase [Corynebacterium sp. TAE3-ERU12]MBV7295016.1 SDR family oxidoreductase [Corynebacterium sp. TAE3-ERU12]
MGAVDTIKNKAASLLPNKYKLPVKGRTALITGAGSGIGRLMALECAKRGAKKVIIWDISEERAAQVAEEVQARGAEAEYAIVDVTNQEAVEDQAAKTGEIDLLINNAGVVSGRTFLETSQESVDKTLDINLRALYIVTRPFLGGMIERNRGTVVVVASAAGIVGVARQTDYSASKWGAIGFAESLRVEMKRENNRVNVMSLCPFYIDTGMFEGVKTKVPWLLPILQPQYVAETTIDGVENGRHQIILPAVARATFFGRLLPVPIFDRLCSLLGINNTMDDFKGREGDRA